MVGLAFVVSSCVGDEIEDEEEDEYVDPGFDNTDGKVDGNTSVEAVVKITCSTVPVRGLSLQIAEELRCMAPGILVPFAETSRIKFASAAVLPYLAADTAKGLQAAATELGSVTVNSGLRALPQQFLLHRWKQTGRCNIRTAATPGRSNHETGRALDLSNPGAARAAMRRRGFSTIANDPVHFDHLASPDLRGVGVEAFQRLWNRNHPEDKIAEDGVYGPQTAARLAKSPSGGFRVAGCQ